MVTLSEPMKFLVEWCATIIEALGITIITAQALYGFFLAVFRLLQKEEFETIFEDVRQRLGRGILLGLEFLIAADIINTVAVELTFQTVMLLGVIVLIRTFLSFALDVEMTGTWPWQNKK